MGDCRVHPQFVSGSYLRPDRRCLAMVNQPDDGLAIDGQRDGLPERLAAKPFLRSADSWQIFSAQIVEVKKQEIVFKPGPQVEKAISPVLLLPFQRCVVIRTDLFQHIKIARLKANNLSILGGNDEEYNLVKIRKRVLRGIDFPI